MRCYLCLLVFCLSFAMSPGAWSQSPGQTAGSCGQYTAKIFELGVRLDDEAPMIQYYLTVHDVETGARVVPSAAYPSALLPISRSPGSGFQDCVFQVHFDDLASDTEYDVELAQDRLYRIGFWSSVYGFVSGRFAAYEFLYPGTAPAGSDFYSAQPMTGGQPDVLFIITPQMQVRTWLIRMDDFSPRTDLDPTDIYDRSFVEDFFADERWIMPYDFPSLCGPLLDCDPSAPEAEDYSEIYFITPARSDTPGFPRTYATTTGTAWRVPEGLTYSWNAGGAGPRVAELQIGAGGSISVKGALIANGVTFSAADPAQGWRGITFSPGSGGSLTGGTVVERVAAECPPSHCFAAGVAAAVTVEGASPTFDGVTIRDPVTGAAGYSFLHGLRVMGPGASPLVTGLEVTGMPGNGVYAHGGATPELRGEGVVLTGNDDAAVLSTGTGTNVFLAPAPNGSGALRGPRIMGGLGRGVEATTSGQVTFSNPAVSGAGFGFVRVSDNAGRGLSASGGANLHAGTTASRSRNWIEDNGGSSATGNGLAAGAGTTISARCNWWGETNPALFRVGATGGGTFNSSRWLLGNPYDDPAAACVNASGVAGRVAEAAAFRGASGGNVSGLDGDETPADRLDIALDAAMPADVLAALAALASDHPTAPEAASALSAVGHLATDPDTPPTVVADAVGLLDTYAAASGPDALRQAALGALVGVRVAGDDTAGAVGAALTLVAMGSGAARTGHAALAFVAAGAGDEAGALAALGVLEASWPGSDEAEAVRVHLAAVGMAVPPGRAAGPDVSDGETVAQTAAAGMSGPAALAVAPNPSASGATVTLTLAEGGSVRLAVYDLVGREVAVLLDSAVAAGVHTVALPTLAPGAYAVRAVGAVAGSARLVVVR